MHTKNAGYMLDVTTHGMSGDPNRASNVGRKLAKHGASCAQAMSCGGQLAPPT